MAYRVAFNALVRVDAALTHLGTNVVIGDETHMAEQASAQQANTAVTVAHDEFLTAATALVASQLEPRENRMQAR